MRHEPVSRITVFGDIHSNLPAFEAALSDMDRREAENRYCLGDLVGYGTYPNEIIEMIREHNILTIMGNYDRGVGNSSNDCGCAYRTDRERQMGKRSIAWTNEHTTRDNRTFLRGLVASIPLKLGDLRVLLVHGSPRRINEYLYEDRPDRSLERLMDQARVDVLVCGHTHLPYWKILPSGRHVVNAGSIGKPKDGDPRAGYVILIAEGSELSVEFIRMAYDIERAARAIEASAMPDEFAEMLRSGGG